MPLLNISPQSSLLVEQGLLKQSIFRGHVYDIKPGKVLYLFCSDRRLRSTQCDFSVDIFIGSNKTVLLGNRLLADDEKHQFALDNNFICFKDMLNFYHERGGLPVDGELIRWL